MRKRSLRETFENFFRWMDVYRAVLRKVREPTAPLSLMERREVFEAFVPKVAVQWDILIEDLLIDCLNRDSTRYAETFGERFPKHNSSALCEVMITGIGYFDVKSFDDAKGKAGRILVPALNPFPAVSAAYSKRIGQFFVIRNYVAHYSRVARRAYAKMCKGDFGMKQVREPFEFLFAIVDERHRKTRFERDFLDSFEGAAMEMAEFLILAS